MMFSSLGSSGTQHHRLCCMVLLVSVGLLVKLLLSAIATMVDASMLERSSNSSSNIVDKNHDNADSIIFLKEYSHQSENHKLNSQAQPITKLPPPPSTPTSLPQQQEDEDSVMLCLMDGVPFFWIVVLEAQIGRLTMMIQF